jgi:hypothetical protein
MSFEERLLVPEARSSRSTSRTERPRSAASRATAAPWIPPPTTKTSWTNPPSLADCVLRARPFYARMVR